VQGYGSVPHYCQYFNCTEVGRRDYYGDDLSDLIFLSYLYRRSLHDVSTLYRMFTFLRKIRKSLIQTGSTRKYLTYAIGEIALVVIGILIALQINNWNGWKKDRDLEKYYLQRIVADLETDLFEMDRTVNSGSFQVRMAIDILEYMDVNTEEFVSLFQNRPREFVLNAIKTYPSGDSIPGILNKTFGINSKQLWAGQEVDRTDFTFREMVNSGKLGLIEDLSLRELLIAHYVNETAMLDIQDIAVELRSNYQEFMRREKLPIIHDMTADEFFNRLGNKEEYEMILKDYVYGIAFGLGRFRTNSPKKTQIMIDSVESYLQRL